MSTWFNSVHFPGLCSQRNGKIILLFDTLSFKILILRLKDLIKSGSNVFMNLVCIYQLRKLYVRNDLTKIYICPIYFAKFIQKIRERFRNFAPCRMQTVEVWQIVGGWMFHMLEERDRKTGVSHHQEQRLKCQCHWRFRTVTSQVKFMEDVER